MKDYEYLRLTIESARDKSSGKPLANNTRLYEGVATVDGKQVSCFDIKLHNTVIVKVLADCRALLFNGGWNTVTTLDRIRTYGSSHVFSESGEWYVWLTPDSDDPRPDRFDRTIPKPYDEPINPGPEPVKSDDGCIAGTLEDYSYVTGVYDFHASFIDKLTGEPRIGYGEPYGDLLVWRNGVIEYVAEQYQTYSWHQPTDPNVDRKQCPHCASFDSLLGRWRALEYGVSYGDGPRHGHKMWRDMMDRYGTSEAWHEAYIADFRARKAYLAAEREWTERNRVPFYDGIMVDTNGYAIRPPKALARKLAAHERKVERMQKRIDRYIEGFIEALKKGMGMPSGGDCWYCSMRTNIDGNVGEGKTLGDVSGADHLLSHMSEGYYVPSLVVNALRERGYKDVGIYMWLDMDADTETMGKPDGRYDNVKRDLRSYMRKRLIPQAPTE